LSVLNEEKSSDTSRSSEYFSEESKEEAKKLTFNKGLTAKSQAIKVKKHSINQEKLPGL